MWAMRGLDIGCGSGSSLSALDCDEIYGVDVDESALKEAARHYPTAHFLSATAEHLPFPDSYFDRINASVSLPYMNIPKVIAEFRRVLKSNGMVRLSLHNLDFELKEWRRASWKSALTFHPYIVLNGLLLHIGLPMFRFPNGRMESFQTERGMRRLLKRNRFVSIDVQISESRFVITALVDDCRALEVSGSETLHSTVVAGQ